MPLLASCAVTPGCPPECLISPFSLLSLTVHFSFNGEEMASASPPGKGRPISRAGSGDSRLWLLLNFTLALCCGQHQPRNLLSALSFYPGMNEDGAPLGRQSILPEQLICVWGWSYPSAPRSMELVFHEPQWVCWSYRCRGNSKGRKMHLLPMKKIHFGKEGRHGPGSRSL